MMNNFSYDAGAVRKHLLARDATVRTIEDIIKAWLRYSPARHHAQVNSSREAAKE